MKVLLIHLAIGAAIPVILVAGFALFEIEWCKSVFRGGDYTVAAILGGDGRHSVSAYCGAGASVFHRVGRSLIDAVFGEGHCRKAAVDEKLLAE